MVAIGKYKKEREKKEEVGRSPLRQRPQRGTLVTTKPLLFYPPKNVIIYIKIPYKKSNVIRLHYAFTIILLNSLNNK